MLGECFGLKKNAKKIACVQNCALKLVIQKGGCHVVTISSVLYLFILFLIVSLIMAAAK